MPRLINAETGDVILPDLEIANSFWKRFVGLMFRKHVSAGFGIWIHDCKSIHTMWMRIPIDVFFLDANNVVIGVQKNVRPWRLAFAPKKTQSVLETPAGIREIPLSTRIVSS